MKNVVLLFAALFSLSAFAEELAPAEWHATTWICAIEAAGGIVFDKDDEKWQGMGFSNRESFTLKGLPPYTHDPMEKYNSYELKYIGVDKGIYCHAEHVRVGVEFGCNGGAVSLKINSNTQRFMAVYEGQYLVSKSSYAELTTEEKRAHAEIKPLVDSMTDDLAIVIGKCSKL